MKVNTEKLKELVLRNFTDTEVSKELGISKSSVYSIRKKLNIRNYSLKVSYVEPTEKQYNILFGCLLGDGSLSKDYDNSRFSCEHSLKQKDYVLWKYEELKSIGIKYKENIRNAPDKRNGNIYQSCAIRSRVNIHLTELYNRFYPDKIKIIPNNISDYYNELSLAVHFQDDGYKSSSGGGYIATQSFDKENIEMFSLFLFNKWGIESSIHSNGSLYIKADSFKLMCEIIKPFMLDTLLYKCVS